MTSTGLTDSQMSVVWQNIVLQCLGITPSGPTDAAAYSQVRVDWPVAGQPAWPITSDVAFIRAVVVPDSYNAAHEVQPTSTPFDTFPEQSIYTRVWQLSLIFYGPNSFDRARQVQACLYQDFVHDILSASNVYLDTVIGTPRRSPELFQNQWWPRSDFSARMNEQVTDTLTKQTIQSVELILEDADGIFDVIDLPVTL
jgi:hypothetical protein